MCSKLCCSLWQSQWVSAQGQGGETSALGSLERWGASPTTYPRHRCCATHDCCYDRLQKRGCGTKFLGYKFSYQKGRIICAKQDSCRSQLCRCDKAAATCFAKARKSYSRKYQYYSNKKCSGKSPKC
ncbi:phospholipase A2 group IIA [Phyllostomus discolor]|uniref:Phospholipase A2 n=1 Tax=Phyllostomus discolor TaxID=89673 RepID=A0A834AFM6_9CHIR|nr:phospholipase A2 group IIA [Phyllostomus discolor]